MGKVTGIGGIFFKAAQPKELQSWYEKHLGIQADENGCIIFQWQELANPLKRATTIWSTFPKDTKYFDPSVAPFMINYRVDDLDSLLAELRAHGITVDEKVEDSEFGRFGWVIDPEGNRIELWQPAEGS